MFICWWSNSNTLFLASNDRTSNFEPNTVFTTFTKLLIELTRTSFFRTSNELERFHLMIIELERPIFGFERSNIELRTLFDPLLLFPIFLPHHHELVKYVISLLQILYLIESHNKKAIWKISAKHFRYRFIIRKKEGVLFHHAINVCL